MPRCVVPLHSENVRFCKLRMSSFMDGRGVVETKRIELSDENGIS